MRFPVASCSFCGKPRSKVRDLIAPRRLSPAYICDDCIHVCLQILMTDHPIAYGPPFRDPGRLRVGLHCSFCRRPQDFVSKLISSPTKGQREFICDRCVRVSLKRLHKAGDEEQQSSWGLARWLKRSLASPAARLHHVRY